MGFKRVKEIRAPLLVLLALLVAIGGLGVWMNGEFYQRYGPFYDSMSYSSTYAVIHSIARGEGIAAALGAAFRSGTVVMPWLEAVAAAPFVSPSRALLVWQQMLWVAVLVLALYWYLVRYRQANRWYAVVVAISFATFSVFFHYNGGISDYRMDLRLYLMLSLMVVWYLLTLETKSRWPWVLLGLTALVAVFSRATAPVYMAAMFGPPLLGRLLASPGGERKRVLLQLLVVGLPVALLAGLYYTHGWDYLHYYYFVWAADPTARLPLSRSIEHFQYAAWSIGRPEMALLLLTGLVNIAAGLQKRGVPLGRFLREEVDWKLLAFGLAPPSLLALHGAGLNPYVAMPAVFGLVAFALFPLRGAAGGDLPGPVRVGIGVALVAVAALNARAGYASHIHPDPHLESMASLQRSIEMLAADARRAGRKEVRYATFHVADFTSAAIQNVLIYEHGARPDRHGRTHWRGLLFHNPQQYLFSPVVAYSWENEVPGRSEEEKLAYLVGQALEHLDYVFLPDEATLSYVETERPHNFINRKVRRLKQQLLATGRWQPVGEPVAANRFETVVLYGKRPVVESVY